MNSKERVMRTLNFESPDRIPIDLWYLPATRIKYGEQFDHLLKKYPIDFAAPDYRDPTLSERHFLKGSYTDIWGVGWENLQNGIHPEAKHWPVADYTTLSRYKPPFETINNGWENVSSSIKEKNDRFLIAQVGNPFERMQFLRGTENLFMDLYELNDDVYRLRDMIFEYYIRKVKKWVEYGIDAIAVFDDWGSQTSLLISPETWRKFFRPAYKEIIDIGIQHNKFIFFHSDGYILPLYDDFINLGVNAINSQLWCMGVENIAEKYAGKITFWGEISRQDTLPFGKPVDIQKAAQHMKQHLWQNGGMIGQGEAGHDVSLENIEALLTCWN